MKPGKRMLPKDRAELIALAERQGWTIQKNSTNNHVRLISPRGDSVYTTPPTSASDNYRGVKIFRSELKRAGLRPDLPKVKKPMPDLKVPLLEVAEMNNPETPKIVAMATTVTPEDKKARGSVRDAILEAMEKIGDRENGVGPDDILARVMVRMPTMDKHRLQISMANITQTGYLVRVKQGKYRIATKSPVRKKAIKPAATSPAPTTALMDASAEEDMKILDEVLGALSKAEAIIKKHKELIEQAAKLRALLKA